MIIVGEKLNSSIKRVAEAIERRDLAAIQDLARRQDRVRIAGKIVAEAEKLGVPREDLYFDPLVLPVSTDIRNGVVFLDSLRTIKAEYPGVKTISGLSNVSYGLPKRKIVNRAFLITAVAAGMDAAIMDPLDMDIMALLKATELVLGQDDFCMNYLMAYRAGLLGEVQPGKA